jgi:hypothetical protein
VVNLPVAMRPIASDTSLVTGITSGLSCAGGNQFEIKSVEGHEDGESRAM